MADALLEQLAAPVSRPLRPADAVAALLVHEDGRYIMQLRDAKPSIFYPGHWGCFGGAVEPGEDTAVAMRRELEEELEFTAGELRRFSQFDFDFAALGHARVYRLYFETIVKDDAYRRFVLHEGAAVRAFDGAELLSQPRVTPYDAFAIWMHLYRRRQAQA
jgi:8-oxo-dGTP pyrophosphatase MutT (NUDIX family)